MSLQDRIHTLRRHGFAPGVAAAILDISPADVHARELDPSTADPAVGVDLSAVDQDITLLNSHKVTMRGAPEAPQRAELWFEWSWWETWFRASPEAVETIVRVLAPDAEGEEGASIKLSAAGTPVLELRIDNATGSFSLGAHHRVTTGDDLEFSNNARGPILLSPNGNRHRLKVGNDGALSTEPVV